MSSWSMAGSDQIDIISDLEISENNSDNSDLEEILRSPQCTVDQVAGFYQNGANTRERMLIWKWLLGVAGSSVKDWDVDHKDKPLIVEDAERLNEDSDESGKCAQVLCYYCAARNTRYKSESGWLELLLPLTALETGDMYACFYSLISKFVPRNCKSDGKPFHLFRLLLLYHDPELCAFLDTKKCSPDLYAQKWFRSLYAGQCNSLVIRELWTRYLILGDPFMLFYLGLVILVNARDAILELGEIASVELCEKISTFPDHLSVEDIEDFLSLAGYYKDKTPLCFQQEYHAQLFGNAPSESSFPSLSQALCLPIPVTELLQRTTESDVRYTVVDCRPKEQFDGGHLPGSVHIDPESMLSDRALFTAEVAGVLLAQRSTSDDQLNWSPQHLCFLGSGREEEESLLHMIVAHFLHRKTQFVSTARGGYRAFHQLLDTHVESGLQEHDAGMCEVCLQETSARLSHSELVVAAPSSSSDTIVSRVSSAVKSLKLGDTAVKSIKLGESVKNRLESLYTGNVSRPYRGAHNVFSIDDDEGDEGTADRVNMRLWEERPEITHSFPVQEILPDGRLLEGNLYLTECHVYNARKNPGNVGEITFRHAYADIARITAKKKHPDLITFKFLKNEELTVHRFLIPNPSEVTREITQRIPM